MNQMWLQAAFKGIVMPSASTGMNQIQNSYGNNGLLWSQVFIGV